MFNSILTTTATAAENISAVQFLGCTVASFILGLAGAFLYMFKNNKYTKNFVVTLALMPAIVQLVIMLVNGNVGAGVAVMGAFSLVRFRSIPGTAKDIGSIFYAMAVGLATGMGYIGIAAIFLLLLGIMNVILNVTKFGETAENEKELRITIPENLDYSGIFDDLFGKYTTDYQLINVKTTNMGTMFDLTYTIKLKEENSEKQFIDEIRCRNGNLRIACGLLPRDRDVM